MDNGLDLYFHNLEKFLRGGTLDPPLQGGSPPQKLKENELSHVTYQSKAREKLYSNMSIKCSFDRQQLKITGKSFFDNCFT